jgi:hypothetical protein
MDIGIARIVIAGVLGAHGVGHLLGWMPALGIVRFEGTAGGSWLLSGFAGEDATRLVAAALFVVPTVGFVAAAGGLLLGQPWWRQVAAASAAVSLAASALYPAAMPLSSTVASVAVDALVLYGVLIAGWGTDLAGA